MTWPHRKIPVPTPEDFAAALPLAEVDAALREIAAWNAQLTRTEPPAPRKADPRTEPALNLKGEPS